MPETEVTVMSIVFRREANARKPECPDCDQEVPEIEIKAYAYRNDKGFTGQIGNACGECGTTFTRDKRAGKKARGAAG